MSAALDVILLEDHPLFREGLASFVKTQIPNINIAYKGGDFLNAKAVAAEKKVSLALIDLNLNDGRAPGEIVSAFTSCGIKVLVLSALNNFESVKTSFSMGAAGFVSKDAPIDEIGKAIKKVLSGEEWISPVIEEVLNKKEVVSDLLSNQELKAVLLYASGLKLEVVARRMQVAPSTVKQYIDRAKSKFKDAGHKISTKTEMYKFLRDQGMLE